ASPDGHAVAAPGAQRLDEPPAARAPRWPREADARTRQAGVADHAGEMARVACWRQDGGWVSPQQPVRREGADGTGMVFEARSVRDGLAGYVLRRGGRGAGAEPTAGPDHTHLGRAGYEVEISKPIDRHHLVA